MTNHSTKDCRKAPPGSASSFTPPTTTESRKCYYCARQGHLEKDCRFKKAAMELKKSKKTTTNPDTATAIASIAAVDDVAPYSFN